MEKTISIKNKLIACTLEGNPQNPPIIMLHSAGSHRGVWIQTMNALREKYFCVAMDFLGFGASDKPDNADYTISAQAHRVMLLADQLGLKKFSLIGHSMGGQIALYFASVLDPLRVENLIGVNSIITGKLTEKFESKVFPFVKTARKWRNLYSFAATLCDFQMVSKSVFKECFYDFNSLPFESWKVDRLAAMNPFSSTALTESLSSIGKLDLTQNLHKIKARTLLIAGRQDEIVPFDQALLAQTLINNSDLAIIEKCGHFPMYEKNVSYIKALKLIF